jgi:hypothetical protein
MAFETIPGTNEQYALLSFDKDGKERTDDPAGINGRLSSEIVSRVASSQPTHVFLFTHGWKGDVTSARDQYNRWIKAMVDSTADRSAVGAPFKPMWIGLHWPSQPFGDEELGGSSFDDTDAGLSPERLVALYVDRLAIHGDAEPLIRTIVDAHRQDAAATELPDEARTAYAKLASMAGYKGDGPSAPPDAEGAPFDPDQAFDRGNAADASIGMDFAGDSGFLGGILGPLRQLSYWTMKKRARTIGESGMHAFVTDMMNRAPGTRFHLMGHSFGTIVVSSILGGPGGTGQLPRKVDSVALIQGAVSLWAFGDSVDETPTKGYFNPWVHRGAVRGPVIVSRSIHDKAVGILYPWASAISFSDGSFDVDEDDLPLYGAIGTFGIRGLPGAVFREMTDKTGSYGFEAGKIYNLESSQFIAKGDGIAGAHSDIDGPEVAHALWQAALV